MAVLTCHAETTTSKNCEEMHFDMGTDAVSPNAAWKLTMTESKVSGPYDVRIRFRATPPSLLTSISKPSATVCWSDDGRSLILLKNIGFTTMADVFDLNPSTGKATLIFSSEKYNKRPFVDYKLARVEVNKSVVVFDVYENVKGIESKRPKRLLAEEYIYLDGQTRYYIPDSSTER